MGCHRLLVSFLFGVTFQCQDMTENIEDGTVLQFGARVRQGSDIKCQEVPLSTEEKLPKLGKGDIFNPDVDEFVENLVNLFYYWCLNKKISTENQSIREKSKQHILLQ